MKSRVRISQRYCFEQGVSRLQTSTPGSGFSRHLFATTKCRGVQTSDLPQLFPAEKGGVLQLLIQTPDYRSGPKLKKWDCVFFALSELWTSTPESVFHSATALSRGCPDSRPQLQTLDFPDTSLLQQNVGVSRLQTCLNFFLPKKVEFSSS